MRRRPAGLAAVCLAGALAGPIHAREASIATHPSSLWEAIELLAPQAPFRPAQVQAVLGTTLSTATSGVNEYFDLYRSTPVALADGVIIANVDLRIARQGSHPGFMVLELGGACVTLAQVREHYGELRITGFPRGRSINETTSHTSVRAWGALSFSFAERQRECLSSIAFDPAKRPPP